ncbi:MAG: polysaccharide biosynthesis protein, partial [Burkholderiales bacterium]|nr:polysaccharide biosynthesis protein [Burkholderiales bacterium]
MTATASTTIWHRLDAWLARLRPHRVLLSLLLDAIVVVLAWNVTYLFRLGFERWLSARPDYDSAVLAGIVLLYLIALGALRLPTSLWRFAGFAEVRRLTIACLVVGTLAAAMVMGLGLRAVPRAVLALHPIVTLMGLVLARIVYRMLWEQVRVHTAGELTAARRAIVMGAGAAARMMLAGIHEQGWTVLGLLDDDPAKQGARIGDVRVLGPLSAVADPALRARATHVIVALPSATAEQRRRALELATDTGLPVLTVPTIEELREGRSLERLRRIEPEDLLGRAPVQLDEAGIGEILCGATVLVTGAGGSIGSELSRQLVRYAPARLVLVELSEFNLYTIEQELSANHPGVELVRLIGDVRDLAQMRQIFIRWRPQLVLHAAAYKHVPL